MADQKALPYRLDYEETNDGDDWWPVVTCRVPGCDWSYDAVWSDLGDDRYGLDWDQVHPAHA